MQQYIYVCIHIYTVNIYVNIYVASLDMLVRFGFKLLFLCQREINTCALNIIKHKFL